MEIDGILAEIGGELSRIDGSGGGNRLPESCRIIVRVCKTIVETVSGFTGE